MASYTLILTAIFAIIQFNFPIFTHSAANEVNAPITENTQHSGRADSWADTLGITALLKLFQQTQNHGEPQTFPRGLSLQKSKFINWAEVHKVQSMWTVEPSRPEDVVAIANWAYRNYYTIRAKGFMHSWAPLTIASENSSSNTILVDTTKHLKEMWLSVSTEDNTPTTVTVATGATWEELLTYLETKGYGVFSFPAVGQMTIGGTLAVGAHGTGLPFSGYNAPEGFKAGSISNLITSLVAVVWDYNKQAYGLKTFDRLHEDTPAFLVHLGRAFITQVTLLVGKNYNLRCQSITHITSNVLFGRDSEHEMSLANYVQNYERVEAQYFPYTDKTWLKLWTQEETKSANALFIDKPYPYTHGNAVARPLDQLISLLASGITIVTPIISRATYELGVSGVTITGTSNVWGPSKNSLLYYHHLAHKFISLGYTVLTERSKIQKVVNKCFTFFTSLTDEMAKAGKYPMNQPVEFRITGLDKTEWYIYPDNTTRIVRPPSLSFLSEVEGHPEYDVAIFLGLHYFPNTPNAEEFMRDWESFLFSTFNGQYATARVEWAKTWGFDTNAPWVNQTVYGNILPKTYGSEWNWAISKLNEYDPHNIYSNEFLNKLMIPVY